jgi:hypothetical protein
MTLVEASTQVVEEATSNQIRQTVRVGLQMIWREPTEGVTISILLALCDQSSECDFSGGVMLR